MWWNFNSFNGKEDFYSRGKNMLITLNNLLSKVCFYLSLWGSDDYCAYLEWDKRINIIKNMHEKAFKFSEN